MFGYELARLPLFSSFRVFWGQEEPHYFIFLVELILFQVIWVWVHLLSSIFTSTITTSPFLRVRAVKLQNPHQQFSSRGRAFSKLSISFMDLTSAQHLWATSLQTRPFPPLSSLCSLWVSLFFWEFWGLKVLVREWCRELLLLLPVCAFATLLWGSCDGSFSTWEDCCSLPIRSQINFQPVLALLLVNLNFPWWPLQALSRQCTHWVWFAAFFYYFSSI